MTALTSVRTSRRRATRRWDRLAFDILPLAVGCAAAASIALMLYLVAPTALRAAIVTAFLGLDQPFVSP